MPMHFLDDSFKSCYEGHIFQKSISSHHHHQHHNHHHHHHSIGDTGFPLNKSQPQRIALFEKPLPLFRNVSKYRIILQNIILISLHSRRSQALFPLTFSRSSPPPPHTHLPPPLPLPLPDYACYAGYTLIINSTA